MKISRFTNRNFVIGCLYCFGRLLPSGALAVNYRLKIKLKKILTTPLFVELKLVIRFGDRYR